MDREAEATGLSQGAYDQVFNVLRAGPGTGSRSW